VGKRKKGDFYLSEWELISFFGMTEEKRGESNGEE